MFSYAGRLNPCWLSLSRLYAYITSAPKLYTHNKCFKPVVSKPSKTRFSPSLTTQSVSLVVDHLVQKYAHTHTHQHSSSILQSVPAFNSHSVAQSRKELSPAALLTLTPASFRYNNLVNPTKTVYMPGNGTFKWLPHATCAARPAATEHSIRRLSRRRTGPLSLRRSRDYFAQRSGRRGKAVLVMQ